MNKTLEILQYGYLMPKKIMDAVGSYKPTIDFEEVSIDWICGVPVVISRAECDWHTDGHIARYSTLLVLRNDTGSYVQTEDHQDYCDQPVGTLLLLDLHKKHRLHNPTDMTARRFLWIAVAIDYDGSRPTPDQCVQAMTELLARCDHDS